MPLELLKIHHGRNLSNFTLKPHPFFNIIYGSNGSGKTTILESIYLLLRSRTFRSSKYKSFISHDEKMCTIFSRFSYPENIPSYDFYDSFQLGICRSRDKPQPVIHLNSKKVNSLSVVTNLVVLGLITPESFNLLDAGPSIRRKFIDWGVFHVEQEFISDWRAYKKILSSRNKLLSEYSKLFKLNRTLSTDQYDLLNCWTPQLSVLNDKLNTYRKNQIDNIYSLFKKHLKTFSHTLASEIKLSYYQGWTNNTDYQDYLNSKMNEDLMSGFTRYGTHRSELKISLKKNMARDILSRGQKKVVIICLILAQFEFLLNMQDPRKSNILLLDDIDSELDDNNLSILFNILSNFKSQIFVTTTNESKYNFIDNKNCEMFHVEHLRDIDE